MLISHGGWYGITHTCLTCGEAWCDGFRLERPFRPGWRKDRIACAKKAPFTTKAEALAAEKEYLFGDLTS